VLFSRSGVNLAALQTIKPRQSLSPGSSARLARPADPAGSFLLATLSTIAVNRRGPPLLPRAELGILGLFRWTVKCLEMSRKPGFYAAKTPRAKSEVFAAP